MKKLLICYASVGSGHQSAAEAIAEAVGELYPEMHVQLSDTLDETILMGPLVSDMLSFLSTTVFSKSYDKAWHTGSLAKLFENAYQLNLLQSNIHKLYEAYQPNVVVCTQAFPASILAALQKRNDYVGKAIPIVAVATDFQVHPYWPVDGIQAFVVAGENSKEALVERGLSEAKIFAYGVPIRPEFSKHATTSGAVGPKVAGQESAAQKTVLFLAGSRKVAPYVASWPMMLQVLRLMARDKKSNFRIKVVLGNNKIIRELLDLTEQGARNIELFGFVDDMPKFISNADIVVTKPGGMIVAETLAIGRPIVMLTKGMGQEAANAEFLHSTEAGFFSDDPQEIVDFIQRVFGDDDYLRRLKSKARRLGRPDAALDTANLINSLAG